MYALLAASLAFAGSVVAQDPVAATPLASKHFTYTALPYQADTDTGGRGPQYGYNICNSTTEGQSSKCQTAFINSIDDWCVWGPPEPNSEVGSTEGEAVAWCTKPGHGTRVIPAGAITGVQFLKAPGYVEVVGYINQQLINMTPDDGGGEMDAHGADQRGNPLGGLVFSNNVSGSKGGNDYVEIKEWHNFMGSGIFCFKACDPADPQAPQLCQHIYDRIGCQYNAPAAYVDGVFESCLSDNQDPPGIYTGADGVVSTYSQPPESLGPITSIAYTAKIPASSQCTTYSSAQLFTGQPSASIAVSSSAPASSGVSSKPTSPASSASRSAAASSTTSASGAASFDVPVAGVWSVVVGVVGAALGAVVAL